ncbi:MAG: GNAT family N-acetyltransferase [Clostridiaceae bacterium]|nr:GNAT family N-acetyltransferase [Clostridiaceae bacterium]
MNYAFIIRKAVESDAPAIHEIMMESFQKYMMDSNLTEPLDAMMESIEAITDDIRTKEVFIALIDGIAVGSARVEILPDNTAYLSRFGVRPTYSNIGVGIAMMSLIDRMLVEKGIKCVKLHTASKNKDLVRFYYGRGFYIESTTTDRGYIRALLVKEY